MATDRPPTLPINAGDACACRQPEAEPPAIRGELVAVPLADLEQLIARASRRWLTVGEAADYSRMGVSTIKHLLAIGALTAYKPRKGKVLIDRRQLDNYIETSLPDKRPRKGGR